MSTKNYTLSIIIPCYKESLNHRYLKELINCLINQKKSYFEIIEIILINDSPEENIEYFSFLNTNLIKVFNNVSNRGQAFSRNKGLDLATGEYVHFIDHDDLLSNDFYDKIQKVDDIIISNCYLFNLNDQIQHHRISKTFFLEKYKKIRNLKFFLIFDNIILSPGQAVFKKEIISKLYGFPELEYHGSDDYGLMFKLSHTNFKFVYSKNSIYFHRLHYYQGKNHLNMSKSRSNFFNKFVSTNNHFNYLCKKNDFFANVIKIIFYHLFYRKL